jgi:hypothetical protein
LALFGSVTARALALLEIERRHGGFLKRLDEILKISGGNNDSKDYS